MMTKEDCDFYRKALTCRNSNFGLAALAYLRRVVENRINDVLDLIVDAAKALGSTAPELARLTEVKQQKRFTEKIEFATAMLPENLKCGGSNPIASLHELASEGIHGKPEDQCTEIFDRCRLAFEYVISNLKAQKESAEEHVRAMRELANKPRTK